MGGLFLQLAAIKILRKEMPGSRWRIDSDNYIDTVLRIFRNPIVQAGSLFLNFN